MAKTAVTGGSGFIGSHVVDALRDAGHEVTVVDYRVNPHRQDVGFENVDLMDLSSVLSATRGVEHIFHMAAVSKVNYAYKYPVYTTALNVVGTANVLEARGPTVPHGSTWRRPGTRQGTPVAKNIRSH